MKRKGLTIVEAVSTLVLITALAIGISKYHTARNDNQKKGAQLAVMKLYETEQLYFKEHRKYTDNLKVLWEHQKRVPEYPVTLVDVRKRAIEKHKQKIEFLRIGDYKLKVVLNNGGFVINATPMKHTESKDFPIFSINHLKENNPKKQWTLPIK